MDPEDFNGVEHLEVFLLEKEEALLRCLFLGTSGSQRDMVPSLFVTPNIFGDVNKCATDNPWSGY